jgi:hypothetical protein
MGAGCPDAGGGTIGEEKAGDRAVERSRSVNRSIVPIR